MSAAGGPPEMIVEAGRSLRGLDFKLGYDSGDRVLDTFYVPALSRAIRYDRSVGYFRSSSLSVAARGMSRFVNGKGTVRLLCGAELSEADRDALLGRADLHGALAERLADGLVTDDDLARRRLEVLAWLAQEGRLEVRVAIAIDSAGRPLVGDGQNPYFHEKIGVLRDAAGDGVAFQGSVNESATAWLYNFESFSAYTSWVDTAHFAHWANRFEAHWSGQVAGFRVYPLPKAVRDRLLSLSPPEPPSQWDAEEAAHLGDDKVLAHYLRAAPHLVGAEALAQATTGVTLFPHQLQVVERLADMYPRSWLVADEVGLGKTISAGMALRRLLLSGRVRRAVILAPANVCRQWQDELFEKFGLWVPRLDRGGIHGAHPSEKERVPNGSNPYALHPVLIASSHLARRPEHQAMLLEAGPYDLVVLDEAHHARRNHASEDRYRPGRLLELLDKISARGVARALWLLTATPMQVDPIELRDLLVHVGLQGALADPNSFERYFREIAHPDDAKVSWSWLDQTIADSPLPPHTAAESAVLDRIGSRVGVVDRARIEQFGNGDQLGKDLVEAMSDAGREELRAWLRVLSPVGQFVTRHSRETLKRYRAEGLLKENLADRNTQATVIPFNQDEQDLYDQLDELIDRLMAAHGTRKGAGFVLTVYRRRLTSSWAAIQISLQRRLESEELVLDDDLLIEAEESEMDTGLVGAVDDTRALPLTGAEIAEIRKYIAAMARVSDSKFDRLRTDLDTARSAGHSTIVFTQFKDTLDDLRNRLAGAYKSQLATFSGSGGQVYREGDGWVEVSKRDLVDAIRARAVTVLLATDAASEGLNLQACSYLINYDMPWNPMRVEQRIGRIDRLGQVRSVVEICSYFIPNTVEESVYSALAGRIDGFRALVGDLQPILGATEEAFRSIFRAPKAEREAAQTKAIEGLVGDIRRLESDGLRFNPEDELPLPAHAASPVRLNDLAEVVQERFAVPLDELGRPVTWEPSRVSRDPETWTALGTYGHPRLDAVLESRAGPTLPPSSSLVLGLAGEGGPVVAMRADRSPPEFIRHVHELDDLGPATARGEAESMADDLVSRVRGERARYEGRLLSLQRHRAVESVRLRFIELVHDTIAAGCSVRHAVNDERQDPISVWNDLQHDGASTWGNAGAFRQRLHVGIAVLCPEYLRTAREMISVSDWLGVRHDAGRRLDSLIAEYMRAVAS